MHKDSPINIEVIRDIAEDRTTAIGGPCTACGSYRMIFDYIYVRQPYEYRCFAICLACGKNEEF